MCFPRGHNSKVEFNHHINVKQNSNFILGWASVCQKTGELLPAKQQPLSARIWSHPGREHVSSDQPPSTATSSAYSGVTHTQQDMNMSVNDFPLITPCEFNATVNVILRGRDGEDPVCVCFFLPAHLSFIVFMCVCVRKRETVGYCYSFFSPRVLSRMWRMWFEGGGRVAGEGQGEQGDDWDRK